MKQISEEIDENITKNFTLSIHKKNLGDKPPETREDYESLEYTLLGQQSELKPNTVHNLWHGISNVALHIPIPKISSGELEIYGNKEKIKNKVASVVEYLSGLGGNLLMGGVLGKVFSFNCCFCDTQIQKPVKNLTSPTLVNCINPKCNESYLLEPSSEDQDIKITRRVTRFDCKDCNNNLDVPTNLFRGLKFDQQINIRCPSCDASSTVIMSPLIKEHSD